MALGKLFVSKKKASIRAEKQLQLAAAILLYKMARADGFVDNAEILHMRSLLTKEFSLTEDELESTLKLAKSSAHEFADLSKITEEIRNNWGNAKRIKLLEYLWILAYADDAIEADEVSLARKVGEFLYLNEMEMVRAQENAASYLGLDQF